MALANGLGGHLLQGLAPSLLRSSFSTVQVHDHDYDYHDDGITVNLMMRKIMMIIVMMMMAMIVMMMVMIVMIFLSPSYGDGVTVDFSKSLILNFNRNLKLILI